MFRECSYIILPEVTSCYWTSPHGSLTLGVFRCSTGTNLKSIYVGYGVLELKCEKILDATKNLSSKLRIGRGGFGEVLKGQIRSTTVAVKVLNQALASCACSIQPVSFPDLDYWT